MRSFENDNKQVRERARRYSTIKYTVELVEIFYVLIFLTICWRSGLSFFLANLSQKVCSNFFCVLLVYSFLLAVIYFIIEFPLSFYSCFLLEHQFGLSQQQVTSWLRDHLKANLIGFVITFSGIVLWQYVMIWQPLNWWWQTAFIWISLSFLLNYLAPLTIIPIFFRYQVLTDEKLRQKIMDLAAKMGVPLLGVYQIDLSSKTNKVNAALVGWGKTRRVLLADNLLQRFEPQEIEVVLAHEFAHQRMNHIVKLFLLQSALTLMFFYFLWLFNQKWTIFTMRIDNLPLFFIYWIIFSVFSRPFVNAISRHLESNADKYALMFISERQAFISTMEKLARDNLADRNPHPFIKFIFFDHPSIEERITAAYSNYYLK
ncbi:MAG: M48 family metallopeptidase [Candidatus Omnitrophica bacterium]|nr:M48 family metallopeptidase [Candidatus Omnitrophota bacterium]